MSNLTTKKEDVVGKFYETRYGDNRVSKPKPPSLYKKLKRFEVNRYQLAYQAAPGGDSVLDIGCGDGQLLTMLKGKYREVWGIDIAKPRIDRILKKYENEPNIHAEWRTLTKSYISKMVTLIRLLLYHC